MDKGRISSTTYPVTSLFSSPRVTACPPELFKSNLGCLDEVGLKTSSAAVVRPQGSFRYKFCLAFAGASKDLEVVFLAVESTVYISQLYSCNFILLPNQSNGSTSTLRNSIY